METKKIYEQPQTEEIKIATSQILCNSVTTPENPAPGMHEINDDF